MFGIMKMARNAAKIHNELETKNGSWPARVGFGAFFWTIGIT